MGDIPKKRRLKNDHQRRLESFVVGLRVGGTFAGLDEVVVEPWMIEELKKAETEVRQLRRQLEARMADVDRPCARCGEPVVGRADRKFCSDRCRIADHRSRHKPKVEGSSLAPSLRRAARATTVSVTHPAIDPMGEL